ncbi:MAG TPA: KH domain-containing protein [Chthonomonadales bacterium]|nr:KH domain-containing protein [Chthonomonadales bacterium]
MKELIEHLARSLVDNPDAVRVDPVRSGAVTVYEVTVAPDDLGKIIGRQGRVANALRVVARALASVEGREVQVEIVT